MTRWQWAALAFLLPLAACIPSPVPEPIYSACRGVLGSSDWQARVELYPTASPEPFLRRRLVVAGKVRTAGGVSVSLDRGPVARLDDPVQQVIVRIEGSPEAGGAPVTHSVRASFPALDRYGAVAIRCGDGIIAEIRDVPIPPREKGEDWIL
ncbi:MAG TPA: hypothetical protein VEA60_08445 [Allosphingosinicella sp.]|nr:hypothetical protein [Allosphingosinicella sp.]